MCVGSLNRKKDCAWYENFRPHVHKFEAKKGHLRYCTLKNVGPTDFHPAGLLHAAFHATAKDFRGRSVWVLGVQGVGAEKHAWSRSFKHEDTLKRQLKNGPEP